jgi:1-acyl-sn-glycerol-3-phosphate acyltransferase
MFFTVIWTVFFMLLMLLCMLALFFVRCTQLFLSKQRYRRFVSACGRFWGRITVLTTGTRVELTGLENVPEGQNVCFISNHQGLFDIPVLLGFSGQQMGFIAKQELFKIPVLSHWMKELHCIFIDRKNPRNAIKSIEAGAEVIRSGYPIVIFPEGTRSQGTTVGPFHYGSIKLALMAEATIVPITVYGTWRIFEARKRIKSSQVKVKIMPPIPPEEAKNMGKQELMDSIRVTMQAQIDQWISLDA